MKISDAFPAAYLKVTDLQGRRVTVTIDHVDMEDIGDDHKPVAYFAGKSKGLVLNRTNANMIVEIVGSEETDGWKGHAIVLFATKVDFQGRRVDAIRVDRPTAAAALKTVGKRAVLPPPLPQVEPEIDTDLEDAIIF